MPKEQDNLFKTSYELFFSKDKSQKEKRNTSKKPVANSLDFYSSHNNITGNKNKVIDDRKAPNGKKLFSDIYHRASLVNMYRGDLKIKTKNEAAPQDILHVFSTKKHFVNKIKFSKFLINLILFK